MFTTAADAPKAIWNEGNLQSPDTTMINCTDIAESSCRTGEANTELLAKLSDAASPYWAAHYCENLTDVHGKSDWYLPALDELHVLYTNRAAIGGFDESGARYWSSSEYSADRARGQQFDDGVQGVHHKYNVFRVRCVRR